MTNAFLTTAAPKRIKLADVREAVNSLTPFVASNGTLIGVAGTVNHTGQLPRAAARSYRHHVASGSYTVLYTVVSGASETVIGWTVRADDGRTSFIRPFLGGLTTAAMRTHQNLLPIN
jgi:hypothetical protein